MPRVTLAYFVTFLKFSCPFLLGSILLRSSARFEALYTNVAKSKCNYAFFPLRCRTLFN